MQTLTIEDRGFFTKIGIVLWDLTTENTVKEIKQTLITDCDLQKLTKMVYDPKDMSVTTRTVILRTLSLLSECGSRWEPEPDPPSDEASDYCYSMYRHFYFFQQNNCGITIQRPNVDDAC